MSEGAPDEMAFVFLRRIFLTHRKGTGWKTSMVSRMEMMPILSRVLMIPKKCSATAMVHCASGGHGARLKGFCDRGDFFPQRGAIAQKRQVYENDRQHKIV